MHSSTPIFHINNKKDKEMFAARKIRRNGQTPKNSNVNSTTVFGEKRRAQKQTPTVEYTPPETNVATPSPGNDDILDRKLRALRLITENGDVGVSRSKVAEHLEVTSSQALYVLNKLRDEESIELVKKKWYPTQKQ